jgi:hypothetical protein
MADDLWAALYSADALSRAAMHARQDLCACWTRLKAAEKRAVAKLLAEGLEPPHLAEALRAFSSEISQVAFRVIGLGVVRDRDPPLTSTFSPQFNPDWYNNTYEKLRA